MKLATFAGDETEPGIGIVIDGAKIVSLSSALPGVPREMKSLIGGWDKFQGEVRRVAQSGASARPLSSVRLLAPIARPGKILAMGLNYADHVAEAKLQTPQHQTWFCKHNNTVAGPYDPVQIPKASDKVDHEVELVFVIGTGGRHISASKAREHVFGYCIGNDVSVRDWQMATPQWMLGKSFDTHGPFGPWITTADEVGDPHRLGIRCFVNGERYQNSNTRHLIFNVWDQIAHLSRAMTLEPGDIIYTGTPSGVGWLSEPRRILKAGDVVRCEIDELGAIENSFQDEV